MKEGIVNFVVNPNGKKKKSLKKAISLYLWKMARLNIYNAKKN